MEKKRTLEDYKVAGAWMRLLKSVFSETYMACSKVMYAKETDKFRVAEDRISALCSQAEDNMFDDFPTLSNEYLDIFYGHIGNDPIYSPRGDVDREQIELASELVKELFGENWK